MHVQFVHYLLLSETLGLKGKVPSRFDATITVGMSLMDLASNIVLTTYAPEVAKRMGQLLETPLASLSSSPSNASWPNSFRLAQK